MINKKAVILLSGGLDSAVSLTLAIRLGYQIRLAITFDYGQKAARPEIKSAQRLVRARHITHLVIKLKWLGRIAANALTNNNKPIPHGFNSKAVWIPNRNGLFINIAASYAEAMGYQYIITGFNKEEAINFPDNSVAFINSVNRVLQYSTLNKVKVISLTARMNKKQIIRQARNLRLSLDKLWSCYEGGRKPCGVCESCRHRNDALSK
jgi:7-cyano-7-deazaguanine synthase